MPASAQGLDPATTCVHVVRGRKGGVVLKTSGAASKSEDSLSVTAGPHPMPPTLCSDDLVDPMPQNQEDWASPVPDAVLFGCETDRYLPLDRVWPSLNT
jgi:hypothetical protein